MNPALAIWYAGIALTGAVLAKLLWARLWRPYPLFTIWICASLIVSLSRAQFSVSSGSYRSLWISTEPVLVLLLVAAAAEVYRHALSHLADPKQLRWIPFCVAAAVSMGAAAIAGIAGPDSPLAPIHRQIYTAKVIACAALFGALAISLWIFRLFPRAAGYGDHARIMLAWLGCLTVGHGAAYAGGGLAWSNVAVQLAWCVCLAAWVALLRAPAPFVHQGDLPAARRRAEELLAGLRRVR